jgi:hypothetical protein
MKQKADSMFDILSANKKSDELDDVDLVI